jgi:hypothetical protein
VSPYADNNYYVQRITHRIKQPSFKTLAPEMQDVYYDLLQRHQEEITRKLDAERALKEEAIPTGGAMITCSMHMPDPDGEGTKQLRLPYETLDWIVKALEKQGKSMEMLEGMNAENVAQMAEQMGLAGGMPGGQMPQGPMPPNYM